MLEPILGVALGLGLAAAAGFRVFVPVLAAALAARAGMLTLAEPFAWMATTPALVAFATATVLEVGAYYVPWLDHALDVVATPAAVAAGIVTSAAVVTDLPPVVTWSVAIIGGGGLAASSQLLSVGARTKSAVTTAGLGNPVVATAELAAAVTLTLVALVAPALVLAGAVTLIVLFARWRRRRAR